MNCGASPVDCNCCHFFPFQTELPDVREMLYVDYEVVFEFLFLTVSTQACKT